MKKNSIICYCMIALAVIAVWAPDAGAFAGPVTQCVGCHPGFSGGSGSDGHSAHLTIVTMGCSSCHASAPFNVTTTDSALCGECHLAPGLPNHHDNAGVATCNALACHPAALEPENTLPPGYPEGLDPCDGSEEVWLNSNTVSLDNDGDLLYDTMDPDCQDTCGNGQANEGEECDPTVEGTQCCNMDCTFNTGDPCEDDDLCTTGDTCDVGACLPGTSVTCQDDGIPCTFLECDPLTGMCTIISSEPAGTACDDDDLCTENDQCDGAGNCGGAEVLCNTPGVCEVGPGTCVGGNCNYDPVVCDSPNTDLCETGPGNCVNDVCEYPSACNPETETCENGTCVPISCSCDGVICDPTGDPCRINACDPNADCTCLISPASAGTACDDDDLCTENDQCDGAGNCGGTEVLCNTPGVCEVGPGTCVGGNCNYDPVVCDSPNTDLCETGPGNCVNDVCEYPSVCNPETETCENGTCVPISCSCDGVICDPTGDPCRINACDPNADCTCLISPASAGTACDDDDLCTENDQCDGAGNCGGAEVLCNTPGVCEVGPGTCVGGNCNYDPVVCDSPNTDLCETGPGNCVNDVCEYPSVCNPGEECIDSQCVSISDPCDLVRAMVDEACPEDGNYKNHGQYVKCATRIVTQNLNANYINLECANEIMSEVARSDVGKK